MSDISTELINILRCEKEKIWYESLYSVLLVELTEKAASMIDIERITLSNDWESLDNARYRERLIPSTRITWEKCIDRLLQNRKQINKKLQGKGFNEQSTSQLSKRFFIIVPTLLNSSVRSVAKESPFPVLWRNLSNNLAAKFFKECKNASSISEKENHQKLLFVGFLWSCKFPEAKYLRQFLNNCENQPNGLRGKLFRIPEAISANGIIDPPIPLARHPKNVILKFESQSDLVSATTEEVRMAMKLDGFCHRIIKAIPHTDYDKIGLNQQTRGARSKLSQMYEYTILAYMALSCIEQMLRTWAEAIKVKHLKQNGHPKGVLDWIKDLNPSPSLQLAIEELYSPKCSNIRNRIMHGNLLEIENKSLEMFLELSESSKEARTDIANDSYNSENIANICINCLLAIDCEIPTSCFGNKSLLSWANRFLLSKADIQFGLRLDPDFYTTNLGLKNFDNIILYADAFFPALRQFVPIGFIGWLKGGLPRSLVMMCAFGFVFENLFRSIVQILGFKTMQISYSAMQTQMHLQYRMLDSSPKGICTDEIIRRIVDHVPVETRNNAERVLRLAVDSRNALAHGAIHDLSEDYYEAMGKIFFKGIQASIECCLHSMIKDAAYFHWKKHRDGKHGYDREDWLIGWREVLEQLRKYSL